VETGHNLQLPLYARVALGEVGGDGASAAYWYVTPAGPSGLAEVPLEAVEEHFIEAVDAFAEGIEAGRFPMNPGAPDNWPRDTFENCKYCEHDAVCASDRDELWERTVDDPRVARYLAVVQPGPGEAVGEGAA
jgi:hypothetical protein